MTETCYARAHRIELPLPMAEAMPLFTPKGEEAWIREWRPEYHHPADGSTVAGMVFVTRAGGSETWWTLTDYRPDDGYARYARVTPGMHSVLVEVQCSGMTTDRTEVEVRYTYVPLSAAGLAAVSPLADGGFATMIEGWRTMILAWLELRGTKPPPS